MPSSIHSLLKLSILLFTIYYHSSYWAPYTLINVYHNLIKYFVTLYYNTSTLYYKFILAHFLQCGAVNIKLTLRAINEQINECNLSGPYIDIIKTMNQPMACNMPLLAVTVLAGLR